VLDTPLVLDELVQRIYTDGQRIHGYVILPLATFFDLAGTGTCEEAIVRAFVGDVAVHPGSLVYFPTDQTKPWGVVLFVQVHVDLDRLGFDWDGIDDDTPFEDTQDGPTQTRSLHHWTGRPIEIPERLR
jgi:hypothetical protein